MLRPSMGDQIPSDPKTIAASFGMGWWKADPQAATELLEKAGFKKVGNSWQTPDGKPFTVRVVVEGEARPVMTRAGLDDRRAVAARSASTPRSMSRRARW